MTNADFYLGIAKHELDQLRLSVGPIVVGDRYSEHFRHAIICSVFSAFAVEYALTELIWVKCFFRTPEPHRRIALLCASKMRNVPQKLEFVRKTTGIDDSLLGEMKKLFDYRNQIAHCHVEIFEGKVLDFDAIKSLCEQGRGAKIDDALMELGDKDDDGPLKALANEAGRVTRSINLQGISTEALDAANENYEIAAKALRALRNEAGMDD